MADDINFFGSDKETDRMFFLREKDVYYEILDQCKLVIGTVNIRESDVLWQAKNSTGSFDFDSIRHTCGASPEAAAKNFIRYYFDVEFIGDDF